MLAIVIDSPPVNLYDARLQRDLEAVFVESEADASVNVRIVSSANPDFFIAHYDVKEILDEDTSAPRASVGPFTSFVQRWRDSEKVSIAKIRGAARGGGCEFLLGLDMRFAAQERARFAFPESVMGILAAGGGTQRVAALAGRARALELLLGHADIDAVTAETYGLVNRALPDHELDAFVEELAHHIGTLPDTTRRLTKMAVVHAVSPTEPHPSGFALEALMLDLLKADPAVRGRLQAFLAAGGQTRDGEGVFASLLDALRRL